MDEWSADSNAELSFQETVAQICEQYGVRYDGVSISYVEDAKSAVVKINSASYQWQIEESILIQDSSSSVVVAYTVVQEVYGFNSSDAAYLGISSALASAVSSGYFTAYLRAYADINGVTALTSASSTALTILANTATPTTSPTAHPNESTSMSVASIALIVVSVIVGIGICAMLVCCVAREETTSKAVTNGTNGNVNGNNTSPGNGAATNRRPSVDTPPAGIAASTSSDALGNPRVSAAATAVGYCEAKAEYDFGEIPVITVSHVELALPAPERPGRQKLQRQSSSTERTGSGAATSTPDTVVDLPTRETNTMVAPTESPRQRDELKRRHSIQQDMPRYDFQSEPRHRRHSIQGDASELREADLDVESAIRNKENARLSQQSSFRAKGSDNLNISKLLSFREQQLQKSQQETKTDPPAASGPTRPVSQRTKQKRRVSWRAELVEEGIKDPGPSISAQNEPQQPLSQPRQPPKKPPRPQLENDRQQREETSDENDEFAV
jgi:hypothetical protein